VWLRSIDDAAFGLLVEGMQKLKPSLIVLEATGKCICRWWRR
jgi:hypothetical protein